MKAAAILAVAALVGVGLLAASQADHGATLSAHPTEACSPPFHVQAAGWDLCWQQDDARAQGVELNQVRFHGDAVLAKIGFPFSITQYEDDRHGPFKDTLGQSLGGDNPGFGRGSMAIDATHCPRFLSVGQLFNDGRLCLERRGGPEPAVALWARYDIFNYRFLQGYVLDSRGVIEPFVRLGGTLFDGDAGGASGTNHFHHMYWRADFDVGAGANGFQAFLRPHPDWNDWDPYVTWTPGEEPTHPACAAFDAAWQPPPCRGHASDGEFELVDPLAHLPDACRDQVAQGVTGWCDVGEESALRHHHALATKWRVHNPHDLNEWGRARSFESAGQTHHDAPIDGAFATFDALVLQHKGSAQEIGFEVPAMPLGGDAYLHAYLDPPEAVGDPVVWFAAHAYHDTRDEERPTMTYHHASFAIEPRDFHGRNIGEDTYSGGVSLPPLPEELEPGGCLGPICV